VGHILGQIASRIPHVGYGKAPRVFLTRTKNSLWQENRPVYPRIAPIGALYCKDYKESEVWDGFHLSISKWVLGDARETLLDEGPQGICKPKLYAESVAETMFSSWTSDVHELAHY
jgi:hypothetical protein